MSEQTNALTTALLKAAGHAFRLRPGKPLTPPRKALILQPCCLSRVMLTTPLLAALSHAFPEARFDWAVSDWAFQAISTNRRITRLIRTGPGDLNDNDRPRTRRFLETVRESEYDTCFVPSQSISMARIARQTGIPQRIGLDVNGHGFAHSVPVRPPPGERNTARIYLSLAAAAGADDSFVQTAQMEFHPPDPDRTSVVRWLIEEFDWLGDAPLVILHPGGGENPQKTNLDKRWPAHRYARLANHLAKTHGARFVVVETDEGRALAEEVVGMMSGPAANRAGQLGLGELGALCELASLYVGNDVGSTYVAAASGCPTLTIYGPTDPRVNAPYMLNGQVQTLWREYEGEFNWNQGVSVEEAGAAADELLLVHASTSRPKYQS